MYLKNYLFNNDTNEAVTINFVVIRTCQPYVTLAIINFVFSFYVQRPVIFRVYYYAIISQLSLDITKKKQFIYNN